MVNQTPKNCKLIIRNLPPSLTEDAFLSTLPPDLLTNSVDFWYYTLGKSSEKRPRNSVAFLHFKTEELAQEFTASYQGHIFITSKGKEQKAAIEIAPFQKIPRANKKRPDPKEGTLEADPSYQEFLASLAVPQVYLPSAEEQLDKRLADQAAAGIIPDAPIITPLIAYVRLRKANRGKGMPSKIAILKRNEGKKDRRRKEKAGKGEKKKGEEKVGGNANNAVVDPNKKSKNRKREREDRKKKKREMEKEAEGNSSETSSETSVSSSSSLPNSAQPKRERPKKERPERTDEEKKNRDRWQVRKNLEPGSLAIQPRSNPSTSLPSSTVPSSSSSSAAVGSPLSGGADSKNNGVNKVGKGRGSPLNGNAASFVSTQTIHQSSPMNPAAPPMIPSAYLMSHMSQYANPMDIPLQIPGLPASSLSNPMVSNGNPHGGRRRGAGRGSNVANETREKPNKDPKFKVYTPKQPVPFGNPQQQPTGSRT